MDGRILRAKLILKGFKVDEFIEKVNENGKVLDRSKYYRALRGDGGLIRFLSCQIRHRHEAHGNTCCDLKLFHFRLPFR